MCGTYIPYNEMWRAEYVLCDYSTAFSIVHHAFPLQDSTDRGEGLIVSGRQEYFTIEAEF